MWKYIITFCLTYQSMPQDSIIPHLTTKCGQVLEYTDSKSAIINYETLLVQQSINQTYIRDYFVHDIISNIEFDSVFIPKPTKLYNVRHVLIKGSYIRQSPYIGFLYYDDSIDIPLIRPIGVNKYNK